MAGSISKAYLSGWEYNRMLQEKPVEPRISALPAAALWQGAHQFWMFKTVLCTAESIDNECAAGDHLGWATGVIIRDLVAEGMVESVDWQALPHPVQKALEKKRSKLHEEHPEHKVRDLIARRDTAALEMIKNKLMQPVLMHYGAIASGAPNSLSNWLGTVPAAGTASPEDEIAVALSMLAAPLLPGAQACRPPGTGLPSAVVQRQKEVQETVEGPLITELMAGDGNFAGPQGYLPYFEALAPHVDAYRPINQQILSDWNAGRERLLRLRDVASKHLWSDLHDDWLPRLKSEDMTAAEFERHISRAVGSKPFLRFLDSAPIRTLIGCLPLAAGTAIVGGAAAIAATAGLDPAGSPGVAAAAAAASAAVADTVGKGVRRGMTQGVSMSPQERKLAVFYQEARKVT